MLCHKINYPYALTTPYYSLSYETGTWTLISYRIRKERPLKEKNIVYFRFSVIKDTIHDNLYVSLLQCLQHDWCPITCTLVLIVLVSPCIVYMCVWVCECVLTVSIRQSVRWPPWGRIDGRVNVTTGITWP